MAAQGAFGTDFYDRSTRTIVGTMLWTEYRPVIKIGPKGAMGSHEIRPIHSAPSLGQSIEPLAVEATKTPNSRVSSYFKCEYLVLMLTRVFGKISCLFRVIFQGRRFKGVRVV